MFLKYCSSKNIFQFLLTFPKGAIAVMKGFSIETAGHMNKFPKAAEVENFS